MRQRGQQAGSDRVVMTHERAELAVITAQALQERREFLHPVGLRHDLDQRVGEITPLRRHRHREQLPQLRVPQEQIRIEEQRQLVTMHRHRGKTLTQPGNVHHPASPAAKRPNPVRRPPTRPGGWPGRAGRRPGDHIAPAFA